MTLSTVKKIILSTLILITLTAGHSVYANAKHNKQYWQESTRKDLHIIRQRLKHDSAYAIQQSPRFKT